MPEGIIRLLRRRRWSRILSLEMVQTSLARPNIRQEIKVIIEEIYPFQLATQLPTPPSHIKLTKLRHIRQPLHIRLLQNFQLLRRQPPLRIILPNRRRPLIPQLINLLPRQRRRILRQRWRLSRRKLPQPPPRRRILLPLLPRRAPWYP